MPVVDERATTSLVPVDVQTFNAEQEFVQQVGDIISDMADSLPDGYRITIVARYSGDGGRDDLVVGTDDLRLATAALAKAMARAVVLRVAEEIPLPDVVVGDRTPDNQNLNEAGIPYNVCMATDGECNNLDKCRAARDCLMPF
jgi:hypothetical protein